MLYSLLNLYVKKLYSDDKGKEIITRFDTDLMTNGVWYTDANGRQMLTRR